MECDCFCMYIKLLVA
ncbi:hypothetical protein LINGRAHAP2_LOCUS22508, partial [Linum grandiflorum]